MPTETAEWIETPQQAEYELVMSDWDGGSLQEVAITREEYIELKRYLAVLRDWARRAA
jgi:trehalose-6-phosphatase